MDHGRLSFHCRVTEGEGCSRKGALLERWRAQVWKTLQRSYVPTSRTGCALLNTRRSARRGGIISPCSFPEPCGPSGLQPSPKHIPEGCLSRRESVSQIQSSFDARGASWNAPRVARERRLWQRRVPAAEKPLRDELLSIERLEERALALAASFTVDPDPRRRSRSIFPRFDDNAHVLRDAYRTLADDVRTGRFVTSAADWLLDNFHVVTSEIRDIRRNLPRTYYRALPMLASRGHAGHARIYAIAIELVRHSDSRLDRHQLTQ